MEDEWTLIARSFRPSTSFYLDFPNLLAEENTTEDKIFFSENVSPFGLTKRKEIKIPRTMKDIMAKSGIFSLFSGLKSDKIFQKQSRTKSLFMTDKRPVQRLHYFTRHNTESTLT